MDILKARKKAKKKAAEEKKPEASAPVETPIQETVPVQPPPATVEISKPAAEKAAPAPFMAAVQPETEDQGFLVKALSEITSAGNAAGTDAQDLDDAIAQIEMEQAQRRSEEGPDTARVQESVADFLAGFEGGNYDEETSYRHSFVREHEAEGNRERYLNIRVASEEYAIRLDSVRETIKVPTITEVPLNPGYVAGIISLRGTIIPVIDLRIRLGLRVDPLTRKARIVITVVNERLVGLLVDQVRDVADIRTDKLEPPPAVLDEKAAGFIEGVGRTIEAKAEDRKVLVILHLEAVAAIERGVAA